MTFEGQARGRLGHRFFHAKQCAQVIATACTPAPAGHDHWTLRLLADKVVQLGYADSFSHETVRRLLKKHPEALAGAGVVHS